MNAHSRIVGGLAVLALTVLGAIWFHGNYFRIGPERFEPVIFFAGWIALFGFGAAGFISLIGGVKAA